MKKIWLTQGQFALVDDADYEWLNQWTWCAQYHLGVDSYYAVSSEILPNGKKVRVYMHRLILSLKYGDKRYGDHIYHDTLDNRRSEIRVVTQRQNLQNRRDGSSKYPGVSWDKPCNKWRAQIVVNKKKKWLGNFDIELEASKVYNDAVNRLKKLELMEVLL